MAKNDKTDKKSKKDKGGKKGKKGKDAAAGGVSVAAHPRAASQVRRAKGVGGVAFFAVAAYLSHQASVPMDQVLLRALAFGIAGYMLLWFCSVTVWRHLVLAELRTAVETGRATMTAPEGPASDAGKPESSGE